MKYLILNFFLVLLFLSANKSFANPNKKDLCLSGICIGMTIEEALLTDINFIDGRILRDKNIEERFELIRDYLGDSIANKTLDSMGGFPKSDENPNSKNMSFIKNIDIKELSYLSTFYPDDTDTAALDNKALKYISKSKQCKYFTIKSYFIDKDDGLVKVEFMPIENIDKKVVSLVEKEYAYKGGEVNIFVENIKSTYKNFNIGTDSWANELGDVFYRAGEEKQRLVLFHEKRPNTKNYFGAGILSPAIIKSYDKYLINHDGCFNSSAPL